MAMALAVNVAFGQTADKLMKKYKAVRGMQYQNLTKKIKKIKEEDDPENYRVSRDITLAELTGGRLHEQHVSSKGSVDLIRRAKARGVRVTAEVTPHHISLTDECLRTFGNGAWADTHGW